MVYGYNRNWHNHKNYCAYPTYFSSNYPLTQPYDANTNANICIPLPTEELGFPSSICASADGVLSPDGDWQITVSIQVYDMSTEVGVLTKTQTSLSVDLGAIFEGFGYTDSGWGGTLGVNLNLDSYCLSACINLYYGVGQSTAWSSLIDCYA